MTALSVVSLATLIDKTRRGYGMTNERLRMHPETKQRLAISKSWQYLSTTPSEFIMGIPAEIDRSVPVGIVRLEFDLAPLEDA